MISRVFQNIISNPTQISKYGVINLKKIKQKLPNCKPIFTLFYIAGFRIVGDNDKLRLIWKNTSENMENMRNVYKILKMDEDKMSKYISLIDDGYTDEQAIKMCESSNVCHV